MKSCTSCKKKLSSSEFTTSENKKGKFTRAICNKCINKKRNENTSKTPDNFIKNLYTQLKSTRRDSGLEWEINYEFLISVWELQKGKCALSGLNMTWHKGSGKTHFNISIDRKNPELGYLPSNVQLVCVCVNLMKQSLNDVDFIWWCKTIIDNKEKFINDDV